MKVLFIEFLDISPHLETGLEIAQKHLIDGDEVIYHFWGYSTHYGNPQDKRPRKINKVRRGVTLLQGFKNFAVGTYEPRDDIYKWPNFTSLNQLFHFRTDNGLCPGYSVYASMGSISYQPDFREIQTQERVAIMLSSYSSVFESALELINKTLPDRIYVFNGVHLHQHAVASAAKSLGVNVQYHERSESPTRYVVTDKAPPHSIRHFPQRMHQFYESYNPNSKDLDDTSKIYFKQLRANSPNKSTRAQSDQVDTTHRMTSKKRVVYFTGSDAEYISAGPDMSTIGGWNSQLEVVLDLVSACNELSSQVDLTIRVHPNTVNYEYDDRKRWEHVVCSLSQNIRVIKADLQISAYDLISVNDIILSSGSTAGLEAAYYGKKSFVLAPCFYQSTGCVPQIYSRRELIKILSEPELDQLPSSCLASIQKYAFFLMNYGTMHRYYEPLGTHNGRFMGISL